MASRTSCWFFSHCFLYLLGILCFQPLVLASELALGSSEQGVDFARDIRPILSDRCFTCHGPDGEQRATDLRLDDRDSALALAISLDQPAESELLKRIGSTDPDLVMPPPSTKLSVTAAELKLLERWIAEGAPYAEHWAFSPPQKVAPVALALPADPSPANTLPSDLDHWTSPAAHAIDRLVLKELLKRRLTPAVQADPVALLRRVTLDLTGLPPTLVELDAFRAEIDVLVAQGAPDAVETVYERSVDRLLASQKFGERMAVDWLDIARYADTFGYQSDRYRATWPWRDWVVGAFNDNLPLDQFITWQLAGDLLPEATPAQILATAFNRHHRQTNEGGSVEEEFRAEYVADRVNTFGAAFLGLTLECCRCHDHKYDPITQENYYQLSAFFNNIDESGLYSHFTDATPTPTLTLATDAQQPRWLELEQRIEQLQSELLELERTPEMPQLLAAWRSRFSDVRQRTPSADDSEKLVLRVMLKNSLNQALLGDYPLDELVDGKLPNRAHRDAPTADASQPPVAGEGKVSEAPELVLGKVGQALRFSGENNATFPAGGNFTRDRAFSFSMWLQTPTHFPRAVVFHRSRAWTDSASHGFELLLEDGKPSVALIHFWPGNALRLLARNPLPLNQWTHVAVTYDGSSQARGLKLFIDGSPIETDVVRDSLTREIHQGEAQELTLAQRFRDVGFKGGAIDELKVFNKNLTALEVKLLMLQDALPANVQEFLHNVSDELLGEFALDQLEPLKTKRQELAQQLTQIRQERSQLLDAIPQIMVMREMADQRPTFLLERGAYDSPGKPVTRGVPVAIGAQLPQADGPTRLDLARWLTDPQHPLTARVAVNRFWQMLFGRGIVATSEDFGLQGALPSHPELLDWLARDLIDSGWDVKRMLKQIVMSATYRQHSDPTSQLLALDPENIYLARGPSLRLSAEMIRDTALAASGLLVDRIGGPPVKPYQPPGLWEEKSGESYQRDVGEGSRRRSLYTFWKRTSPPPAMMTFDASNREVCVVNRQATMTPLQILVLLNDPQLVEAAVALGERASQADSSTPARLRFIFRSLCSREPTPREIEVLEQLYAEQHAYFSKAHAEVGALLKVGDHVPAAELDQVELVALSVVAQGLMSYDEFIMKR